MTDIFDHLLKQLQDDDLNCIIIICPTKEQAGQLVQVFQSKDINWTSYERDPSDDSWNIYRDQTIYLVRWGRNRRRPNKCRYVLTHGSVGIIPTVQIKENINKCAIIHALAVISD
jgi:hypothetical protein